MSDLLFVEPTDNVAIALSEKSQGERLAFIDAEGRSSVIALREKIPVRHKLAVRSIPCGETVVRYGFPIGRATSKIEPGDWVHSHNVESTLSSKLSLEFDPGSRCDSPPQGFVEQLPDASFLGYKRSDGRTGLRNELWILPMVGCINGTARMIADRFAASDLAPNIDGVHAFPHPWGCSQLGEDLSDTQRILAGLARHPNAGGVLLLGLGCENNTCDSFQAALQELGKHERDRIRFLACQNVNNETDAGVRILNELAEEASTDRRTPCPASDLCIGLKCGGSDAMSGVTANPLLGRIADRFAARGGRLLMTETPEMFGAEQALLPRCRDENVFHASVDMLQSFRDYFTSHGQPVGENPSPGNREGGITTLEEKSLGCVTKSGRSPIVDVIPYGGQVKRPGLSLLNGPGADLIAVTALAAAGAQIILFTTGRGTPLGGPIPTLKISSNSELAASKPHWIDFDAGRLTSGQSWDATTSSLEHLLIETASGSFTLNERNDHREIAVWRRGVTL
jgi:altronate hydrolase